MININVLFIAVVIIIGGCNTQSETSSDNNGTIQEVSNNGNHAAKVEQILDAGTYIYLEVTENDETYWIAVTRMDIEVGEIVYFSKSMEMKNFESKTLNRTFESVLFVQDASESPDQKSGSNPHQNLTIQVDEEISIETPADGKTVEQVYNEKESLNCKTVKVKGKVVKFNAGIMNRNWFHIQDGTGDAKSNDLVVTSQEEAAVGDVVTLEGIVASYKDFGSGYFFPVIIEDAKIVK